MEERMQRDICFHCQKKGHWAINCPDKSANNNKSGPSKSPVSSKGNINSSDLASVPDRLCPCSAGKCIVLTSSTKKNPGRKFYKCPGKGNKNCDSFLWCDEFDVNENVPMSKYPKCSCGAGICHLSTEKDQKVFVCPVKKGQGACNFHQLLDSQGTSPNDSHFAKDEQLASPLQTFRELFNNTGSDGNGNGAAGIMSPVSALCKESLVKEDMGRKDSSVDALLSPIGNLTVNEKVASVVAEPGKCYLCCEGGHRALECHKVSYNSLCFKCGSKGHWIKNCPN